MIVMALAAFRNGAVDGFIESGGTVVLMVDKADIVAINSRIYAGWGRLDSPLGVQNQVVVHTVGSGHGGFKNPENRSSDF